MGPQVYSLYRQSHGAFEKKANDRFLLFRGTQMDSVTL